MPGTRESTGVSRAVKLVEDPRQVGGWNTDPVVAHLHHRPAPLLVGILAESHDNLRAVRAVFRRVVQQVLEHPGQARGIPLADQGRHGRRQLNWMTGRG